MPVWLTLTIYIAAPLLIAVVGYFVRENFEDLDSLRKEFHLYCSAQATTISNQGQAIRKELEDYKQASAHTAYETFARRDDVKSALDDIKNSLDRIERKVDH